MVSRATISTSCWRRINTRTFDTFQTRVRISRHVAAHAELFRYHDADAHFVLRSRVSADASIVTPSWATPGRSKHLSRTAPSYYQFIRRTPLCLINTPAACTGLTLSLRCASRVISTFQRSNCWLRWTAPRGPARALALAHLPRIPSSLPQQHARLRLV